MEARLRETVAAKGGTIVRGPYKPEGKSQKRVVLRCVEGHEWETQCGHVVRGSWCPRCVKNSPVDLADLQTWAADLGGKCLTATYQGSGFKYLWECGRCCHQWHASWNNIRGHNSWCPNCRTSVRENIVRAAFQESFLGEEFGTDRAAIGMELDGYCEKYSLAFECDGMQHRVRVEHFQRAEGAFEAQKERDEEKDFRALMASIDLIRIPDRGILKAKDIRRYVHAEIQECGYLDGIVNTNVCSDAEFYRKVRGLRSRDVYGDTARGLVAPKGGVLVSEVCPTTTYPITVDCGKGHQFQTDLDNLRRGRWCPDCSPNRKKTDEEIRSAVEARGYKFVSTNIEALGKRFRRYITIQCATSAHPPSTISWSNFTQHGRGCKLCGFARRGKARSLGAEAVDAETSKFGIKLIGPYSTRSAPTAFECTKESHQFTSSLQALRNIKGPRCPVCTLESNDHIRLLTPTGPEIDLGKGKLRFECGACNQEFEATLRSMRMRTHKCPNKHCPSRQ